MAGQKLYTRLTDRTRWLEGAVHSQSRAGRRVRGKKHENSCPQNEMLLKLKA